MTTPEKTPRERREAVEADCRKTQEFHESLMQQSRDLLERQAKRTAEAANRND